MNMNWKFIVSQGEKGTRIDRLMVEKLPEFSRSFIQKLIKSGNIKINDETILAHYRVMENEIIDVFIHNESEQKIVPQIDVAAQTPEFIVINKPAGVVVHPDSLHKTGTAVDFILEKFPEIAKVGEDSKRPGIVHRLDKDASGLMVVARTKESFDNLKKQFQNKRIEKEYSVLVYGADLLDYGEITTPLSRSKTTGKIVSRPEISEKAKTAHTIYKVSERRKNFALLSVQTKTGRTHQIRVHFHSIGHSVAGDKLYEQKITKTKAAPPRLFLHAAKLAFFDLSGQKHSYQMPLPPDLQQFWDQLK